MDHIQKNGIKKIEYFEIIVCTLYIISYSKQTITRQYQKNILTQRATLNSEKSI